MEYYQRIRNIREDKDIKQYKFAELIDVKPKNYNLYENGNRSMPLDILNKVMTELNLSLDYILGLTDITKYPHMKDINPKILANNLRKYRKKLGYTQDEMAKILNCNQQTLSEYERGNLKIPIEIVKKFAQTTNISADTLTGRCKTIINLKTPV